MKNKKVSVLSLLSITLFTLLLTFFLFTKQRASAAFLTTISDTLSRIEDNTDAYKNKDYSTINDYIIKNNIMIFSKTITEERKTNP